MVEYWQPEAPFELPRSLKFEMKSETDLYEFRKVRAGWLHWLYVGSLIVYAFRYRTNQCQRQ